MQFNEVKPPSGIFSQKISNGSRKLLAKFLRNESKDLPIMAMYSLNGFGYMNNWINIKPNIFSCFKTKCFNHYIIVTSKVR